MIKIYHNPRCRKSREGLDILEKSGKEFEVIKYLEDVPSKDELKTIVTYLGIDPINLVRKNEIIWKEKFRDKYLTDEEIFDAMITYPKLIERPIVVKDDQAVIGRPASKITSLIE
ncbi:arsenate reductase (glutaredoxin) [Maribacter sp. X9]|uniref:arsenate reductase (glutaredoxin) n=1 Tax=Maribacter sp. X9 TaxID=3402159 RepID=UPI003AF40021